MADVSAEAGAGDGSASGAQAAPSERLTIGPAHRLRHALPTYPNKLSDGFSFLFSLDGMRHETTLLIE
jgi:hypothetical protein